MASRKKSLVKHCRIFQWVEAKDPEFAGAIRDLCLEGVLSPGKGGAGVTFLYPEDAAYRADIVAKTYSDDADAAVKLIEALIVPDALHKASDFQARKVGNRLGVPFVVEGVNGGKVRLAGGAELAQANDFSPLERRAGKVAVWKLTGRVPAEGSGYAPPARVAKTKRGGAEPAGGAHRLAHIAKVAQDFLDWETGGHQGPDPFLAASVGLLHSLGPEDLRRVTPFLDYYPHVTLHLLVEPHKTTSGHLLSDQAITNWGGARVARDSFAEDYLGFMRGGLSVEQARSRRGEVERARAGLERSRPQAAIAEALHLYDTGAFTDSLPRESAEALAPGRKLWMDELRYQFHVLLEGLTRPHNPSELVHQMAELCSSHPGNDYARELSIMNKRLIDSDVAPRARLLAACRFIRSTDFLYQLAPPEAVGDNLGSPQPDDVNPYNPSAEGLAYLNRAASARVGGGGADCLSPQARRELELYVRLHGKLPDLGQLPA